MAYTTQAKIEAYKGRSLTSNEVTTLTELLPSVDAVINEILGASYSDTSQSFYFDGGVTMLDLPGLTTITSVSYVDTEDNATALDSTEYVTYPLNSTRKTYIKLRSGQFADGVKNIKVVGNTGDAPSDIVLASTIMASDFLDDKSGQVSQERIGDWSVTYENMTDTARKKVNDLLRPYRDIKIA